MRYFISLTDLFHYNIHMQFFISSHYCSIVFPAPPLMVILFQQVSLLPYQQHPVPCKWTCCKVKKVGFEKSHELNEESWFVAWTSLDLCFHLTPLHGCRFQHNFKFIFLGGGRFYCIYRSVPLDCSVSMLPNSSSNCRQGRTRNLISLNCLVTYRNLSDAVICAVQPPPAQQVVQDAATMHRGE